MKVHDVVTVVVKARIDLDEFSRPVDGSWKDDFAQAVKDALYDVDGVVVSSVKVS